MQPSGKTRPFDSWDAIKILALVLMFIDHSGYFFFADDKYMRAIGRGAAPIFLFLGGYAASYRFKWDLFVLAVLMSVSEFLVAGHLHPQNILFTILGCRMIFAWLEKRGRKIEKPWEWYMVCLAWILSTFLVEYGSLGLIFAISGYLKRRRQDYPPTLPRNFLAASFIAYGSFTQLFSKSRPDLAVMVITLCIVWWLLEKFTIRELQPNLPRWLAQTGKWFSYYSGYIYAFHLIALEWITGMSS